MLQDDTFQTLAHLQILDLSGNKLIAIRKNTLRGLTKLQKLKLPGNKITSLEYGSFSSLKSIAKIDLSDNPLHCDCHLAWLIDWLRTGD